MTDEETLLDLRRIVAAYERHRQALLSDMDRSISGAGQGAVVTEVVFFHGVAFEAVVSVALRMPTRLPPAAVRAMQGAMAGRAVFNLWRNADTSLAAPEQLGELTEIWVGIVDALG